MRHDQVFAGLQGQHASRNVPVGVGSSCKLEPLDMNAAALSSIVHDLIRQNGKNGSWAPDAVNFSYRLLTKQSLDNLLVAALRPGNRLRSSLQHSLPQMPTGFWSEC